MTKEELTVNPYKSEIHDPNKKARLLLKLSDFITEEHFNPSFHKIFHNLFHKYRNFGLKLYTHLC